MKNKHLWVGYLTMPNNGKTLVASDARVETGKSKTVFLYNQERDKIVEYSRDIIEPKLQNAPAAEYDSKKIAAAYKKALRNKLPNLYRIIFSPNSGVLTPAKKQPTETLSDDDDIKIDDDFEIDDDDVSDDNENYDFEDDK